MKLVFLFFVSINLLFFVWQSDTFHSGRKVSNATLTAIPSNVEKLVLLKEVQSVKAIKNKKSAPAASAETAQDSAETNSNSSNKDDTTPAPAEDKLKTAGLLSALPPQPRTANKYMCYALGPFKEVTQATPIALKLRDLGAITNSRRYEKEIATGYWVYLPQFNTWQDARKKVMELEDKGMKDMFIMGRGSMKNAVSVGLFSSESSARSRMSRLVELGEDPKMQTQFTKTPEFWIDIDIEAGKKNVVSAIEAIAKGLTLLELVKRKCDE